MNPFIRAAAAALASVLVAQIYYSPSSPTGALWTKVVVPRWQRGKVEPPKVSDYRLVALIPSFFMAMILTKATQDPGHYSTRKDIVVLGLKLTFVATLITIPHAIYEGSNMLVFFINRGYDVASLASMIGVLTQILK